MGDLASYPYRARTDARSAMAERLAEYVASIEFSLPKGTKSFAFAHVFDTWSDFSQRAVSGGGALPAAAVLPDRAAYEDSALTPRAIESTWSGGDPTLCDATGREKVYPIGDGSGDGFVLYTLAEIVVPFVLVYRATTKPMRKAIARRLEQSFIEDGGIVPDVSQLDPRIPVESSAHPVRYGRLLECPSYFNRKARFTLESQQLLDSEASAGENRWMGQMEITGHMQVCVIRRARSMKPRVTLVVDEESAIPT